MKAFTRILKHFFLFLTLTFCFSSVVHAETYHLNLRTSYENNLEHATLTAKNDAGRTVWTYNSGYYPAAELSNFHLITNDDDGSIYLVENGSIKCLNFYTGRVEWTNYDFGGSPTDYSYTFSSSGKLYIAGYYGPDLFVVDTNGRTICRVNSLSPGLYNVTDIWWYSGDYMRIAYESSYMITINVLDYFGRKDGIY